MATKLRKLRITRVDRVWAPANGTDTDGPLARIVLAKARSAPNVDPPETGDTMPEEVTKTDEAPAEPVAAEPAPVEDAPADEPAAEPEPAPEADDEEIDDVAEVDKAALPASVRKALEQAQAVAKAAEARVAKMEDERDAARWLEVAKGLPFVAVAKKVGGNAAEDTAALLHGIAKAAGPQPAGQLVALLESAQERLAQSELLKSKGADGTSNTFGDAEAQLQKAAADIRKAAPGLTAAQAYKQAVDGNPDLAVTATQEVWTANA
jgi:hypothetical protein